MQTNRRKPALKTHEGATAKHIKPEEQLRRSVMACMLWEKQFYEEGDAIAERIRDLVPQVLPLAVAEIAIEAREKMKLRHVPLLLVRQMACTPTHKKYVANTLARIIQRPDELTEFVSLYWKDGKQPLSGQVKKGLARAFPKFKAYQLAKYNRDNAVKLRDVLFLSHAKPENDAQAAVWKQLVDGTLTPPDTWEVALSAGADKKETWERLLKEQKLGGLALLRNLRNMREANVDQLLVKNSIVDMKTQRILPFRFIAAARFAPDFEPVLEQAMFKCVSGKLPGKTTLLVDVSGSMDHPLSARSDMTRLDAACGLAMLLREICEDLTVRTFSDQVAHVPLRRGFALRDAIVKSLPHGSTYLGAAVRSLEKDRDRLIVITDEQSHDSVPDPVWKNSYMINVASSQNGVGYGPWVHIDGWSEAIVDYIKTYEGVNDGDSAESREGE